MLRDIFVDPFILKTNPPMIKKFAGNSLAQLRFGVKSIISVKGHSRQFGNTIWDEMHKNNISEKHAPCVKTLLKAGAILMGTLHTSEFAFDINGSSAYGTPRNPRVMNGVPGGSSSGSAAAVASNAIDFALGTDTGGSIRIPAAYCGVWSLRPTKGAISTANVLPVGAHFDTVGIMANNANILNQVGRTLLPEHDLAEKNLRKIYVVKEALDLCPDDIKYILNKKIDQLKEIYFISVINIDDITHEQEPAYQGLSGWKAASTLLLHNTWETLSPWLEMNIPNWQSKDSPLTDEVRSNLCAGKSVSECFRLNPQIRMQAEMRIAYYKAMMNAFLLPGVALLIPTTPYAASEIGTKLSHADFMNIIALTSIASLADLPQVQMPLAEDKSHRPLGLSLLGGPSSDRILLNAAVSIESHLQNEHEMTRGLTL